MGVDVGECGNQNLVVALDNFDIRCIDSGTYLSNQSIATQDIHCLATRPSRGEAHILDQ
jgi:hypothetical protein